MPEMSFPAYHDLVGSCLWRLGCLSDNRSISVGCSKQKEGIREERFPHPFVLHSSPSSIQFLTQEQPPPELAIWFKDGGPRQGALQEPPLLGDRTSTSVLLYSSHIPAIRTRRIQRPLANAESEGNITMVGWGEISKLSEKGGQKGKENNTSSLPLSLPLRFTSRRSLSIPLPVAGWTSMSSLCEGFIWASPT